VEFVRRPSVYPQWRQYTDDVHVAHRWPERFNHRIQRTFSAPWHLIEAHLITLCRARFGKQCSAALTSDLFHTETTTAFRQTSDLQRCFLLKLLRGFGARFGVRFFSVTPGCVCSSRLVTRAVELEPEMWFLVPQPWCVGQGSCTNNKVVLNCQSAKSFWSRSLKFALRFHSPAYNHCFASLK